MREIRFGVVTMALLSLVAVCAGAQNISLAVDAAKVPQKLLDVEEVLPVTAGPLTLYCPKWIPGENADGPVSNLANLKFDTDGTVVPWTRDLLDIWTFHADVPAGKTKLHVAFDYIESAGGDRLLVHVGDAPAGKAGRRFHVLRSRRESQTQSDRATRTVNSNRPALRF